MSRSILTRAASLLRRRRLLLSFTLFGLLLFGVTQGAHAQSPGSGDGLNLGDTLEQLTDAAADMIPAFVRTVENPLGGWFDTLAFYLAWLLAFMFFLKMLRADGGAEPESLFWFFARVAVIFALLTYCGDINGDGVRGDLLNRIGQFGNSIAYGQPHRDGGESFLGRKVKEQKNTLENNYSDFVENTFMVKVNNEDRLVRYPEDDERGFQLLSAMYSNNHSLEQMAENLDPKGWNMSNLFQFLNIGRGIVEFGDLFLLILQGFLVVTLRLAAPFMIAVAMDRDFAKRISINFAWGAVVAVLLLPVVSQIVRFFAYAAANLAMDARSSSPYFTYDPTTAKIIANGSPEYMIIICAVIMVISGLCMFASPYISYKLAQGGVFEAISGAVSGWMGAMISTGISTFSMAAGISVSRQAEQTNAYGQSQAEGVTARSQLESQNIGAVAQMSSRIAESRSQMGAEVSGAQVTAWSGSATAAAQQDRLVAEQEAGIVAGDMQRDAEMMNAGVTGQKDLDDALINDSSFASPLIGGADNLRRAFGFEGSAGSEAREQQGGWSTTNGGSTIPGSERPFVPGQIDHSNGLGYRPLDRTTGNQKWDSLIDSTAKELGIDPAFSTEIFRKETGGFQPQYVSGKVKSPMGASGMGQFMPETARDYGLKVGGGVDERNDPMKAIPAAMRMHRDLLKANDGNPLLSAAGYNAGQGAVNAYMPNNPGVNSYTGGSGRRFTVSEGTAQRAQGIPQNAETRDYVATVGTRLGIGNRTMYKTPEGVRQLMASTTNSRVETRAQRDAYIGMENAERTTQASANADRYRADATMNAGGRYTSTIIGINQQEAGLRTAIAQRANAERERAARGLAVETIRGNTVSYYGQAGNPNAKAGTPEHRGAIGIREDAALKAADLRAKAAFIQGFGNTIATQANSVMTNFNRY